jgi:hypothetical protein
LHDSIEDILDICNGSDVIILIDFGKEMHEPILWITDINRVTID